MTYTERRQELKERVESLRSEIDALRQEIERLTVSSGIRDLKNKLSALCSEREDAEDDLMTAKCPVEIGRLFRTPRALYRVVDATFQEWTDYGANGPIHRSQWKLDCESLNEDRTPKKAKDRWGHLEECRPRRFTPEEVADYLIRYPMDEIIPLAPVRPWMSCVYCWMRFEIGLVKECQECKEQTGRSVYICMKCDERHVAWHCGEADERGDL